MRKYSYSYYGHIVNSSSGSERTREAAKMQCPLCTFLLVKLLLYGYGGIGWWRPWPLFCITLWLMQSNCPDHVMTTPMHKCLTNIRKRVVPHFSGIWVFSCPILCSKNILVNGSIVYLKPKFHKELVYMNLKSSCLVMYLKQIICVHSRKYYQKL